MSGRTLSRTSKEQRLFSIGAPLRLLRDAPRSKDQHLFGCAHCGGKVERTFDQVSTRRDFHCRTLGCSNYYARPARTGCAPVMDDARFATKAERLRLLGSPLRLVRDAPRHQAPHRFACSICGVEFERAFSTVVGPAHSGSCTNVECENYRYLRAANSHKESQEQKNSQPIHQQRLDTAGAPLLILEVGRTVDDLYAFQCRLCEGVFERKYSTVMARNSWGCKTKGCGNWGRARAEPVPTDAVFTSRRQARNLCHAAQGFAPVVKQRAGGRCLICGSLDDLESHHMDGLGPSYSYALDPERGVCLCSVCHRTGGLAYHGLYGHKQTTAEQFAEFYESRTGRDFETIYDLVNRRWRGSTQP